MNFWAPGHWRLLGLHCHYCPEEKHWFLDDPCVDLWRFAKPFQVSGKDTSPASPFLPGGVSLCQEGVICALVGKTQWENGEELLLVHLQLQKASVFPWNLPTETHTSDSAWSLSTECPPKDPGRTYTAKNSANIISFFINDPLIIFLPLFHDPATVQVEMTVMTFNEICT